MRTLQKTLKVAKYGSLSFSDEDKTKIVELIMERDSLQDKDDLKLKIKQSIKAWAHIFFLIIFHFLDKQSPNNIYAHTVPARVLKVSLIFPFSHSFFRHWQRDESSSPESLKSPFKGYQK